MEPLTDLGKSLILLGVLIVILGGVLVLSGKIPFIGRLPGDIIIQKKNFTFYFPLATSILLSLILSLLFWILSRR
ncbi:MAG TPA: DUF2905 domain-containing protein [Nitrospirae bacterium]|nr:DUF2905 domain-containing protein [Nitrospirota bacterium]HDY70725.1 DUF2905 domain-containing protein [Nitrospirota bacterium]